jgi:hypothetical protein
MIRGAVNADLEAIIRLTVRGPAGQQQRIADSASRRVYGDATGCAAPPGSNRGLQR